MENQVHTIAPTKPDTTITFHLGANNPVFTLKFDIENGILVGTPDEITAANTAAKIFYESVKVEGQTLLTQLADAKNAINQLTELANEESNDMALGAAVREYLKSAR